MLIKPKKSLFSSYTNNLVEAGCDEVGIGALCGPIVAASVIFPKKYTNLKINDSKKLTSKQRISLDAQIKKDALDWSIGYITSADVSKYNPVRGANIAIFKAINKLKITPELLLIDGNKFKPFSLMFYKCIVKGDGKYISIAAASILAKNFRDRFIKKLSYRYPNYSWDSNVGYSTKKHVEAIQKHGITRYHRKSYSPCKI